MTRRRDDRSRTTAGQAAAVAELRAIAAVGATPLTSAEPLGTVGGRLAVRLRLDTTGIVRAPGGLPVAPDAEDVVVLVPSGYPLIPPTATVEHERFVGHPHVLQGDRLCVHLDADQEWHQDQGAVGFLDALWRWFEDAAAGRFDARSSLHHPVGGVLHRTEGAPTIVVRRELDLARGVFTRAWMRQRTDLRLDLVPRKADAGGGPEALVLALPGPLVYGAGTTLFGLCVRLFAAKRPAALPALGVDRSLADPRFPEPLDVLAVLAQTAARNPPGAPLHLVLAVPGPSSAGGHRHLIAARVPQAAADRLRRAARSRGPTAVLLRCEVDFDSEIEWCVVSEERPSATVRRDRTRPVSAFQGKHVYLWGCGGLGSWTGEFLARAGVRRLTLCDPATIGGGLLVRQDFDEADIGQDKATALRRRLRAIRDDLLVDIDADARGPFTRGALPACDLLIDATVSNAVGTMLGLGWPVPTGVAAGPVVARISTDKATGTLGLLVVTTPGLGPDPEETDRLVGDAVRAEAALEHHLAFWDPPAPADELVPAPGCSVPTFHGSAADLAAVSASLLSLLGPHLHAPGLAGAHLVALPHSSATVHHRWISAG